MSEGSPGDFRILLDFSGPGPVDRVVFERRNLEDHLVVSHESNSLYDPGVFNRVGR
jgi:hypothetical protein